MIGFRDMTFCTSKTCTNSECPRQITDKVIEEGTAWWGSPDFPMAMASFDTDCAEYIEGELDEQTPSHPH